MVTIMGVTAPGSLILTAGHQAEVDLQLLLILSGQPILGALPSPRTQTTAPEPPPPVHRRQPPTALPAW